MKLPKCPKCSDKLPKAFVRSKFECPKCHIQIKSNIKEISFYESLIFSAPSYLLIAMIAKYLPTGMWTMQLACLLLAPIAIAIHFCVIKEYMVLRIEEGG